MKENKLPETTKFYLSKAYILKIDNDVYQSYKQPMIEFKDTRTGKIVTEKTGKPQPWGKPLRSAKVKEPIFAYTFVNEVAIPLTSVDENVIQEALLKGNYKLHE